MDTIVNNDSLDTLDTTSFTLDEVLNNDLFVKTEEHFFELLEAYKELAEVGDFYTLSLIKSFSSIRSAYICLIAGDTGSSSILIRSAIEHIVTSSFFFVYPERLESWLELENGEITDYWNNLRDELSSCDKQLKSKRWLEIPLYLIGNDIDNDPKRARGPHTKNMSDFFKAIDAGLKALIKNLSIVTHSNKYMAEHYHYVDLNGEKVLGVPPFSDGKRNMVNDIETSHHVYLSLYLIISSLVTYIQSNGSNYRISDPLLATLKNLIDHQKLLRSGITTDKLIPRLAKRA